VARVAVLCPDLLFGSKLEGGLRTAGHDVTRYADEGAARAAAPDADVLVVDLTDVDIDGATLVESMRMGRELGETRTLGFYSHVDVDTRRRAQEAGFDQVVPRSRMAREMGALVERLAASGARA
jgi:DNA-binding NarL/FixJ family response regulator